MSAETIDVIYSEELYKFNEPPTVVIDKPWNTFTREEINLLHKILASIRQSQNTVRIVEQHLLNMELRGNDFQIISFGVNIFPEVQWYQFTKVGRFSMVKADPLSELDETKKKHLWSALRQMFEL